MDLLGDLGATDQLTSVRTENAVLLQKVKDLSFKVKELMIENETLKAEVEMYRQENAIPNFSQIQLGGNNSNTQQQQLAASDAFCREGNGVYASSVARNLTNLHASANPLSCCLSPDDAILATGGADWQVKLMLWNASSNSKNSNVCTMPCAAPVITTAFAPKLNYKLLAAGCMDGSVSLWSYESSYNDGLQAAIVENSSDVLEKHAKFCKTVAWSLDASILATASADGTVHLYKINKSGFDYKIAKYTSLHFTGPVEAMCFSDQFLICYSRGTPYLSYFCLEKDLEPSKVHLNAGNINGGFDDHVSYCIMDLKQYQNKYLAAATDASRNIIFDLKTGQHIRNLYGHSNDAYANPKIAWSASGQYLMGNTQEDGSLCVWDISSSKIVETLAGHSISLRDLYSSSFSDTVVTTAFDKETRVWINEQMET